MTTTPEGFLICLDVPIARTGTQEYLGYELGLEDRTNDLFTVNRTEDEVFSPATIASFEGKCVTADHPPDSVTTENVTAYNCGHAQHIRRGTEDQSDLLIADLFITDRRLIEAIQNGLREVSCGYDCEYAEENGQLFQRRIRGNHIAVVPSGRAGHRVAIQDSAHQDEKAPGLQNQQDEATGAQRGWPSCRAAHVSTAGIQNQQDERTAKPLRVLPLRDGKAAGIQKERGKTIMEKDKKKKRSLFATMFSRAVRDMEPEEVADAVDELVASQEDSEAPAAQPTPTPAAAPASDSEEFGPQILAAIKVLGEQIAAALAPKATEPAPADTDPIQQLADELQAHAGETPADQEASVTIPADEDPISQDEEPEPAPAASLPENPIPGADRAAAVLSAINAIKPVIASMPENQRKAASDKAAAELRKMLGRDAKPQSNGYAGVTAAIQNTAKAKAKDHAQKAKADSGEIGRGIMASRNPHYAKK